MCGSEVMCSKKLWTPWFIYHKFTVIHVDIYKKSKFEKEIINWKRISRSLQVDILITKTIEIFLEYLTWKIEQNSRGFGKKHPFENLKYVKCWHARFSCQECRVHVGGE